MEEHASTKHAQFGNYEITCSNVVVVENVLMVVTLRSISCQANTIHVHFWNHELT